MIGILFLTQNPEDRLSRLIDRAFKIKYGDEYLGFTHTAVHFGRMCSEITTSGVFTHEVDQTGELVKRIGAYAEFEFDSGVDALDTESNIIKRLQKEYEDGDTLIEDELIDWYFDPSLEAFTCVTFVLQMLGIRNISQNVSPQELYEEITAFPELFVRELEFGNGLDHKAARLKIGTGEDYVKQLFAS